MKYTAKKYVSEVVIDLEDGCVIKLTKNNIQEITTEGFERFYWNVVIKLTNGIIVNIKLDNNSELLGHISSLVQS